MKITTNNVPRDLLCFCDFSESEQSQIRSDFDWLDDVEETCHFFKYRGQIFHVAEFMRDGTPDGWHGNHPDGYFTGTLVKIISDDLIIAGRYLS